MGTIARRVKELRWRKGWNATQLGEALTTKGIPWDRFTVRALEGGKRQNVTIQEFLALAVVLDVAPVHLLFPLHEGDYRVTPNGPDVRLDRARHWFRGNESLPRTDRRTYYSERPEKELEPAGPADQELAQRIVVLFRDVQAAESTEDAYRVLREFRDTLPEGDDDAGR